MKASKQPRRTLSRTNTLEYHLLIGSRFDRYCYSLQKKYEEEDRALPLVEIPNGKKQSKACEAQQAKREAAKRTMWVDKYRPTKFTDLLGEEVRLSAEQMFWGGN
jgi:hypothetical protein